ncbi:MAG: (Fe-S)-binding protein [Alphaproteobacteria bacterium]|nr:(Fe-S)-binding protein [Alphaproteobacteria bacterium]
MTDRSAAFLETLDRRVEAIADACTACGACATACPTLDVAGIDAGAPEALTAGVRAILQAGGGPAPSEAWARVCCGSGHCLTVCPEGINPRFMLTMARRTLTRQAAAEDRRAAGKAAFQKMSRGVRVLSRLSLPPDLLARLSPRSHPERDEAPDVVFYTGCNLLKTPHIGLLCLDVLERLGITYEVQGGPGACCGILQTRPGDTANAGRQAFTTLDRMAAAKTSQVLSWCPTCQVQFGETMIPSYREVTGKAFDMTMFPVWLAARLEALRPMMTRPVPRRVALYEYAGELGVNQAVRALLGAVPGLELVEIGTRSIGYTSSALAPLGRYHRDRLAAALRDAEAAGVDTLVGLYHSDHREFAGHEAHWPFAVANYMELVGESMGLAAPDRFKALKAMQDADAILTASADQIRAHGLDPEEVRSVILADMLGDQALPADRSRHAAE